MDHHHNNSMGMDHLRMTLECHHHQQVSCKVDNHHLNMVEEVHLVGIHQEEEDEEDSVDRLEVPHHRECMVLDRVRWVHHEEVV